MVSKESIVNGTTTHDYPTHRHASPRASSRHLDSHLLVDEEAAFDEIASVKARKGDEHGAAEVREHDQLVLATIVLVHYLLLVELGTNGEATGVRAMNIRCEKITLRYDRRPTDLSSRFLNVLFIGHATERNTEGQGLP